MMAASFAYTDYGKSPSVVDVGQVISGKYKLLRLLGDGGMGSVYEAEHLVLGTHVAIKVLHPELARKSGLIDRFLQEARVSAQIRSTHVVQVTDVDRTPELAYLVMELLEGEPLSSVLQRERRLAVATACEYTLQILEALEAAHALGVVHRDLKPDNVFLTFHAGKPVLKLIDFGIAKLKRAEGTKNLTVAGMLMGTPEYMAPEQAYAAENVDIRADIYSVGVMLYEMLSGKTPASGDDPRIVVLKVERGDVTPLVHAAPGILPELAGLVHRAMAPKPDLRFASATEMRLALEGVMRGKRAGTAQLPQKIRSDAPPPAAAPAPPPPVAMGTGTVMGAPAPSALTNHGSGPPGPYNDAPGAGTVRAAPMDPSMFPSQGAPAHAAPQGYGYGPPPHAGMPTPPPHEPTRPPKRGNSGVVAALAILAFLLGAGAVTAYLVGQSGPTTEPVPWPTTPPTTPPTTTTPPPPTQAGPTTGPVVTSTPLTPGPNVPTPPPVTPPPPRPSASTVPDAGTAPSASTPPPFVIPGLGSVPVPPPPPRPPWLPADQPWPPQIPGFPPAPPSSR